MPRPGLDWCVLQAQERWDECSEIVAALEERGFLEPEAESIKSALELRRRQRGDLDELRQAADHEPDNLPLQLRFAEALAGAELYREALERCLALVQRDRQGVGEEARRVMVDIFRVLPDDSELTGEYRRKLSTALF